eukprot:16441711-Heterocapsa_arctica.AAC.1
MREDDLPDPTRRVNSGSRPRRTEGQPNVQPDIAASMICTAQESVDQHAHEVDSCAVGLGEQ